MKDRCWSMGCRPSLENEVSLRSAHVTACTVHASRGGYGLKYELEMIAVDGDVIRAWLDYDTLRALAASLRSASSPDLPRHIVGGSPDRAIVAMNSFLTAALADVTTAWSFGFDDGSLFSKQRADVTLVPMRTSRAASHAILESPVGTLDATSTVRGYPSLDARDELVPLAITVVGSRVVQAAFAEYGLEIATSEGMLVRVWHRHKDLRAFGLLLKRAQPWEWKQLPPMPPRTLLRSLRPSLLAAREGAWGAFLSALLTSSTLRWAIDIDETTRVVKRPLALHCVVLPLRF
ncbi:hypothetical protein SDRG_09443 [Saprolegnia diclina VS20]|uniref:PX domain-containing protein n=1 Tax=Saprolegnia diclina (strain VS20) TaxID=1156394 RepID=T0RRY1_SAPDV|nr:hypothetical protein SDRG_09443 [Saprolegnia diclina VS20]EQC32912.1 hypothetical protein SDRG_09443 [Saprolegnia diclina VS20]|eukprot:XP_008613598.1 hypothetical protein SDRG_09443 [Saprolegnia diclina VS20]